MKIAVYYDLPFGGAFVAMTEIVERLRTHHQIEVFHNQESNFTGCAPKRLWQDLESLVFQYFKQRHQANLIDQRHFDVVLVSHDRHSQAPWLLRFLKTPSVFLCQEPTRAYFEAFLGVDPKLPLLNRVYEKINRYLRKKIEVVNAQFATRLIANSAYSAKSIFKAYGLKATTIHMGFNPKIFYPYNLTHLNQVLVIGNHEPQKALPFVIEVVSLVKPKLRPKLVIVSPRHRQNRDLLKLAEDKGVNLEIKEGIKTTELCRVYNQSKVLLAVARLEPFGLSAIESLACGTPVLAVDEGGYRETVVHQKSGLLIKRDSLALAKGLEKLLTNEPLRQKMGLQGIKDVQNRFMWETTVSKIEKIFHELT